MDTPPCFEDDRHDEWMAASMRQVMPSTTSEEAAGTAYRTERKVTTDGREAIRNARLRRGCDVDRSSNSQNGREKRPLQPAVRTVSESRGTQLNTCAGDEVRGSVG